MGQNFIKSQNMVMEWIVASSTNEVISLNIYFNEPIPQDSKVGEVIFAFMVTILLVIYLSVFTTLKFKRIENEQEEFRTLQKFARENDIVMNQQMFLNMQMQMADELFLEKPGENNIMRPEQLLMQNVAPANQGVVATPRGANSTGKLSLVGF
jgi:hypothetical protein